MKYAINFLGIPKLCFDDEVETLKAWDALKLVDPDRFETEQYDIVDTHNRRYEVMSHIVGEKDGCLIKKEYLIEMEPDVINISKKAVSNK